MVQEADLSARYDSIVHMMTAAAGAELFYTQVPQPQQHCSALLTPTPTHYTQANNSARRESSEEAQAQDRRIMAAWSGHQGHFVVDNEADRRTVIATVNPNPKYRPAVMA